jgi:hypothetical protein
LLRSIASTKSVETKDRIGCGIKATSEIATLGMSPADDIAERLIEPHSVHIDRKTCGFQEAARRCIHIVHVRLEWIALDLLVCTLSNRGS